MYLFSFCQRLLYSTLLCFVVVPYLYLYILLLLLHCHCTACVHAPLLKLFRGCARTVLKRENAVKSNLPHPMTEIGVRSLFAKARDGFWCIDSCNVCMYRCGGIYRCVCTICISIYNTYMYVCCSNKCFHCVWLRVRMRVCRCRLPLLLLITAHAITTATIATTKQTSNAKSLTIAAVARNLLLNSQTLDRLLACRTGYAGHFGL